MPCFISVDIALRTALKKMYAGVLFIEFSCTVTILEQQIKVWLVIRKKTGRRWFTGESREREHSMVSTKRIEDALA